MGYVKGLAEGLEIDVSSKEGKLLLAITDLLEDIVETLADVEEELEELGDDVEELEDDLEELGEELEDLADALDDLAGDAAGPESEGQSGSGDIRIFDSGNYEEDDDDDENGVYQLSCPACNGEIIVTDEELDDGQVVCPSCKKTLEFEIRSCGEDGCGCGCGHGDEGGKHSHGHDEDGE